MVINSESLCDSCRVNFYIRNGWASNIINPDETVHSAFVLSLSDITSTSTVANDVAETIAQELKNVENTLNR